MANEESDLEQQKEQQKQDLAEALRQFPWETVRPEPRTEEELKKIALGIHTGTIYTDRHCPDPSLLSMIFMPMIFLWPNERHPQREEYATAHEHAEAVARARQDFLRGTAHAHYVTKNVDLVFEDIAKAGPRSINGQPIFSSFQWCDKEEREKIFAYVEKLKAAIASV